MIVGNMLVIGVLEQVATMIGGKFVECDDGYVICVKSPIKGVNGIDWIYDFDGVLEEVKPC